MIDETSPCVERGAPGGTFQEIGGLAKATDRVQGNGTAMWEREVAARRMPYQAFDVGIVSGENATCM